MAEKTAPATILACMEGPMVGLFVSGGYTAGWPRYVRADIADKLIEALLQFQPGEQTPPVYKGHMRWRWLHDCDP